jgi:hypothetical protein
MVRREERCIYTSRQNLTVQIYVESSDPDRQDFRHLRFIRSIVRTRVTGRKQHTPELAATAATSDSRDFRRTVGSREGSGDNKRWNSRLFARTSGSWNSREALALSMIKVTENTSKCS